jgi:hypothetical protein
MTIFFLFAGMNFAILVAMRDIQGRVLGSFILIPSYSLSDVGGHLYQKFCCVIARRSPPYADQIPVSPLCFDYIRNSIPLLLTFCVVFLSLTYLLILHYWGGYRRGAKGNVGARISTRSDCPDSELHQSASSQLPSLLLLSVINSIHQLSALFYLVCYCQ